jgi:hypothetical protein
MTSLTCVSGADRVISPNDQSWIGSQLGLARVRTSGGNSTGHAMLSNSNEIEEISSEEIKERGSSLAAGRLGGAIETRGSLLPLATAADA